MQVSERLRRDQALPDGGDHGPFTAVAINIFFKVLKDILNILMAWKGSVSATFKRKRLWALLTSKNQFLMNSYLRSFKKIIDAKLIYRYLCNL